MNESRNTSPKQEGNPRHRPWRLYLLGVLVASSWLGCVSGLDEEFSQNELQAGDERTDPGDSDDGPTENPSAPTGTDEMPTAPADGTDGPHPSMTDNVGADTDGLGSGVTDDELTDATSTDEPAPSGSDDPLDDEGATDVESPDAGDGGSDNPAEEAGTSVCPDGVPEMDGDGDGTPDCIDQCVDDPDKTEPGECGCDVPEATEDGDDDGTIDCLDGCPEDRRKTEPGACGCGIAEDDSDGDGDGVLTCIDECPTDPNKGEPGGCGCGMPDTNSTGGELLCVVLEQSMRHRYSFGGLNSSVVPDLVGNAHGDIVGTQASGGRLTLAGETSDEYVDLPNQVLDGIEDLTVEVWLTWSGGSAWQRVFDFGSSDGDEGSQGTGTSYLFLTPESITTSNGEPGVRAVFKPTDGTETVVSLTDPLPEATPTHVAVVFDDTGNQLVLFLNGERVAATALSGSLSEITMVNNWLGRSQYSADPEFGGSLDELRIYSAALSEEALSFSFSQGPSAVFP